MAKIDRLGWADGMSFISYGVRVGVRVNDPSILKEVIARLPPGSKRASLPVVDQLYSVIGGSADCPTDPKANCTAAPEYVGFRVVRGAAKPVAQ